MEEVVGPAPAEEPVADVRAADREEDNAVGALVDFLEAFARLPARFESAAPARAALAILKDAEGLKYLTYKPVVEWSEVETRRKLLEKGGHVETIRALGGGALLQYLDEAHVNYGVATGTTAPVMRAEPASIEEPRAALADAMRTYVARVVSSVSRKKPETRERAQMLLRPLTDWRSSASVPTAEPAPPGTPIEPAKPSDG